MRNALAAVQAVLRAGFGPGTGNIVLDNLACSGTETRLVNCSHNGLNNHNCAHSEDAGVICGSKCSTMTNRMDCMMNMVIMAFSI